MPSLDETLETIWTLLGRGVADRRHGFHWPVVCSVADGVAQGRVVVLRGRDPDSRTLWFHTDRRSAKVDQLEGLSWVFYDARARRQVRVHGESTLADPPTTDREWSGLPATSRRTYLVEPAPGTELGGSWSSGLPAAARERPPTDEEAARGRQHFAVVITRVSGLETLLLGRSGHERARFGWDGSGWVGTWLVP